MLKQLIAQQMMNRRRGEYPVEYLEQKHVDLSLPYPNDSSFFYGGDREGNAIVCRMAFRDPKRKHEYCFDFYLKGLGFFGIKDDPGADGEGFRMGNLKWEPVEIGKQWQLTYDGPVRHGEGTMHQTSVDLIFTGEHPIYNFADHADNRQEAEAIASEKWTRDFFLKLKELSQTHIEQTGSIKGTIILDDKRFDLTMRAVRDHTFGSRTWLTWDRHYLMSGSADNGYQWTATVIRFDFLGQLTAGFVIDKDGEVDAIVDCTSLEEVSAKQLFPDNGIITLKMRSGKTHTLEFFRHRHFPYLMDETYSLFEGIGSYQFNDSDGLGLVEFGFNKERYKV